MRILALDAAFGPAVAGVVDSGATVAETHAGDATSLPERVAGLPLGDLGAVAVTVGPGSFTGLRGALSLALGIAAGRGVRLVPVTVAEALGEALPHRGGRALWIAIDSRRDRLFLDPGDGMMSVAPADLPTPRGPILLAGDAAREVAAALAARGADVSLSDVRTPRPRDIARAAERRLAGEWPDLPPLPLYVDPPAVRPP